METILQSGKNNMTENGKCYWTEETALLLRVNDESSSTLNLFKNKIEEGFY